MWLRSRKCGGSLGEIGDGGRQYGQSTSVRARSAPAERRSKSVGVSDVEKRLCIVKRNRMRHIYDGTEGNDEDVTQMSPPTPPLPPAIAPPCPAYPTFDLVRTPKHEQHLIEALVAELTDVIVFPSAVLGGK